MKKYVFILVVGCLTNAMAFAGTKCFLAKENGQTVKQEGDCATRHPSCSTFKIAISLMGFDSGILSNQNALTWDFHPDYDKLFPVVLEIWREPHSPSSWIKNSVVWYSQVITQKLGTDRFKDYVAKLDYGNRDVSGDIGKNNGLTHSWFCSSLKISGEEQVAFLQKLVGNKFPVSQEAQALTRDILYVEDLDRGWKLYGKTGIGFQYNPDRTPNKDLLAGWFVGWIEKGNRQIVVAHYIEDDEKATTPAGRRARDMAKEKLLKLIYD